MAHIDGIASARASKQALEVTPRTNHPPSEHSSSDARQQTMYMPPLPLSEPLSSVHAATDANVSPLPSSSMSPRVATRSHAAMLPPRSALAPLPTRSDDDGTDGDAMAAAAATMAPPEATSGVGERTVAACSAHPIRIYLTVAYAHCASRLLLILLLNFLDAFDACFVLILLK